MFKRVFTSWKGTWAGVWRGRWETSVLLEFILREKSKPINKYLMKGSIITQNILSPYDSSEYCNKIENVSTFRDFTLEEASNKQLNRYIVPCSQLQEAGPRLLTYFDTFVWKNTQFLFNYSRNIYEVLKNTWSLFSYSRNIYEVLFQGPRQAAW